MKKKEVVLKELRKIVRKVIDENSVIKNINATKRPFTVRYVSPNKDRGNALYYTTYASNEADAKRQAMANPKFTKYMEFEIRTKSFRRRDLYAYITKNLQDIGKVQFFEGDPRD